MRIILIISAKVILLFIFGTCPMPDWRYGYHIVWMGSSLPCVRKRRGLAGSLEPEFELTIEPGIYINRLLESGEML